MTFVPIKTRIFKLAVLAAIPLVTNCKTAGSHGSGVKGGIVLFESFPAWTDPQTGITWNYAGRGEASDLDKGCSQFPNSQPPDLITLKSAMTNGLTDKIKNPKWFFKRFNSYFFDGADARIWVKKSGTSQFSVGENGMVTDAYQDSAFFHIVCMGGSTAKQPVAEVPGLVPLFKFSSGNNFGYGLDDLTPDIVAQGFTSWGAQFRVQEKNTPGTFQIIICQDRYAINNRFIADNQNCDGMGTPIAPLLAYMYKTRISGSVPHCRSKTQPYTSSASPQGCGTDATQVGFVFPLTPTPVSTIPNNNHGPRDNPNYPNNSTTPVPPPSSTPNNDYTNTSARDRCNSIGNSMYDCDKADNIGCGWSTVMQKCIYVNSRYCEDYGPDHIWCQYTVQSNGRSCTFENGQCTSN